MVILLDYTRIKQWKKYNLHLYLINIIVHCLVFKAISEHNHALVGNACTSMYKSSKHWYYFPHSCVLQLVLYPPVPSPLPWPSHWPNNQWYFWSSALCRAPRKLPSIVKIKRGAIPLFLSFIVFCLSSTTPLSHPPSFCNSLFPSKQKYPFVAVALKFNHGDSPQQSAQESDGV